MKLNVISPRKSINKAFLKVKPNRNQIEKFKHNILKLYDQINETETEEFHKNIISKFLSDTYYSPNYYINTKGRADLVIHNGKSSTSTVGVLIETKKPSNKSEMPTTENINTKALHELILYYLRERITEKNIEVKFLIVTNIYEWFIFNANDFDRLFAQNKKLVKQFTDFEEGRLADTKTDFFYKQIVEPFLNELDKEISFTYLNLKDYEKVVKNNDKSNDNKLVVLYKLFSPENLLKLPFANDSNSLDRRFYTELLHIIGLYETKQGSKKIIERNPEGKRNPGSLIENTIAKLDSLDKISRLDNPGRFGANKDERLFNIALELCITWINRILFLKLVEAQLVKYHKGDKSYEFLNTDKIHDYDDLEYLFFSVLAKPQEERSEEANKKFGKVPYLNSSLFELSKIEDDTILISNLRDEQKLPILSYTVLKDQNGKKLTGELETLEYLFAFLNAYDFSSEGGEEIQEENKTLINASVLGLIFEKINGYKDGSFFTPGFITMYMSRETIRRAVVQKFNEVKGWNCKTIDEVYDLIEDRNEANQIINSLKICDPAVGSGHFLVSALNEIIAIKHDLRVLQDRQGRRLKEYNVEVVNDELVVTDEDGELFEYNPGNSESQRVQETLFHEKKTIIENCLFGVDINPNSVNICRLRLWIELLKNAYYLENGALETLPNIDINIKCGNSLISRFNIDADLKQALRKSESKWTIEGYRSVVATYRNARDKEIKHKMERIIEEIKGNFRSEISINDPKVKRLNKLRIEFNTQTGHNQLFKLNKREKAAWNNKIKKLTTEINKLETEIEEIKNNKIYENAFEWRFEFPEVLDDDGNFVGFDVIIGNPPYMRVQEIKSTQPEQKRFYESKYENAKASYDLANIFFELAIKISASNSHNAFIFPHKFFNSASTTVFREYLKKGKYIDEIAHFGANMVFEDADTYTCITQFSKKANNGFYFQRFPFKADYKTLMLEKEKYAFITYEMIEKAAQLYGNNQWILFDNEIGFNVFKKIYANSKYFSDVFEDIFQGLATSKDELYILNCIDEEKFCLEVPISGKKYQLEKDLFKPFLMGKNVKRYSFTNSKKYVFFPYKLSNGSAEIISLEKIQNNYPQTFKYIKDHERIFKERERGRAGKMRFWYAYIYPKNLNKFEKPKLSSMEICANFPNVFYDDNNFYHPTTVYSWVKRENTEESYEYLLAIANSKLLWWFLKITGDTLQGDARRFKTNYLNPFPIPDRVDKEMESQIIKKVKNVMNIKKQDPDADTTDLESEIDRLVYELYGLTDEEIRIVEESIG